MEDEISVGRFLKIQSDLDIHAHNLFFTVFFFSTAICSPACQNGGTCTSPDSCSCPDGWAGSDCSEGRSKNCLNNMLLMPNSSDSYMAYRVQLWINYSMYVVPSKLSTSYLKYQCVLPFSYKLCLSDKTKLPVLGSFWPQVWPFIFIKI